MLEIKKIDPCGFCFGVTRAIEIVEKTIDHKEGQRIFSYGQLIHNKGVTDRLKERGLDILEDLEEGQEGDILIIRSHGAPRDLFEQARKKGLELIDATCPYVVKIQRLVEKASSNGKTVVVVGDKNHPEVIGIVGWAKPPGNIIVVQNKEGIGEITGDSILLVAQTTINEDQFQEVGQALKRQHKDVTIENTICTATRERQEATKELAKESDVMVVIGGKNSSNSKKLVAISQRYCDKTIFVENNKDLSLKTIDKCSKIGVAAGASTPVSDIEEVIAKMSEVITERNEMEDYLEAIEKSLRLPRLGEIVEGTIHQVTDKEIIVNLGCKKDGVIPKEELNLEADEKITEVYKEGDTIQAKVVKTDDGDGTIMLSKKKLQVNENWEEISQALDDKLTIDVKVVRVVNGGVIASYKEVAGFIPLSQLSDRFIENAEEFMGQVLPIKISRVDKYKGKAVFSHKAYLAEQRQSKMAEVWEKLDVGDIIEGTVMRFTDYGAFVDIGGIDGLLHISEISWGKLKHPQEVLAIGEKINVKVLSMNSERGKISLGLKQTQPEPWSIIDDKYQVGQILAGRVVQIKEYGAFVELEPGLDGLVHISEVAHKRVTDLNDELTIGEEVSTKILEIDKEKKRISLSIKETLEPPIFEEEEEAFEAGDEVAEVEEAAEVAIDTDAEETVEEAVEVATEETVEEVTIEAEAPAEAEETPAEVEEEAAQEVTETETQEETAETEEK
jgi:4-hydroxy-3-methylbut-2-enyl diphosphate reductase